MQNGLTPVLARTCCPIGARMGLGSSFGITAEMSRMSWKIVSLSSNKTCLSSFSILETVPV